MDLVELAVLLGDVEQRVAVHAGDLLHQLIPASVRCPALPLAGQGAEVDLGERLLDQLLVVVVVERLARDLLGREDGEVGDLLADLLQRAPRLRLDVLARGGDQLLALRLALGRRLGDRRLRGLAGAGDDVVGLLARLLEPLAVLGEQLVGLLALCSDASMFSRIAFARFSSASAIRGNAVFESTNIVIPNSSRVQIISPRPGETRKLPPSSSAVSAASRRTPAMSVRNSMSRAAPAA